MSNLSRLHLYIHLMRLNKPIGILLLLWPTLWALWLASGGVPSLGVLFIFVAGVVVMRSAGCVVNDIADRRFDGHVARTRARVLVQGLVSVKEAIVLAGVLAGLAFILVLFCNVLTIKLAFVGAALAVIYPFMKRVTHLPQLGLGMAFAWGVPMAFAAILNEVPPAAWFLFIPCLLWPVIYDTMYAMVDKEDDMKIGIKSTAILFKHYDILIITCMQFIFLALMISIGFLFQLHALYFLSVLIAAILCVYQLYLIHDRDPANCFRAFMNNHWLGLIIFLGIALGG